MAEQAESVDVRPLKNGRWSVSGVTETFEDRAAAVEAAKDEAGSEALYDADGTLRAHTPPERPIHLLRLDGSLVGELPDAPMKGGGQPIIKQLEPAVESSTAEGLG